MLMLRSDMIILGSKLLADLRVRTRLQGIHRYVLIDEAQDLSIRNSKQVWWERGHNKPAWTWSWRIRCTLV